MADLERQCCENAQYSRCECFKVSGAPNSVGGEGLESKLCEIFSRIGVDIDSGKK